MDVFSLATGAGRAFLRNAAIVAAHDVGVFGALPGTAAEIAARLGIAPRRLRALLDVLALEGVVTRGFACETIPARPANVPDAGWGRLADVLRADRPLATGDDEAALHRHLFAAGAAAAREVAARIARRSRCASVVDAGGGMGAYGAAVLAQVAGATVTLVDRAPILALARTVLPSERVHFVAGDLTTPGVLGDGHDVVILANVLHLHPPEICARIVAEAARAVAPGGWVVVKDFRVEPDRSGPAEGVLFALNMALYTDGGDVYDAAEIAGWLEASGLVETFVEVLEVAPGTHLVGALRKP